jgi:hypothetical protein
VLGARRQVFAMLWLLAERMRSVPQREHEKAAGNIHTDHEHIRYRTVHMA